MNSYKSEFSGTEIDEILGNSEEHVSDSDIHVTTAEKTNIEKIPEIIESAESRYITPQKFGAIGNGAVNDTTAVAAAIAYAKTNRCAVFFPAGTYLLDKLVLEDDLVIAGEDMNTTVLKKSNTTGSLIYSKVVADSTKPSSNNVTIKDITIDGSGCTKAACGISYKGFRLYLENITVKSFLDIGIKVVRGSESYAGKHGHMKDLFLFDNHNGNMLYEGETDNNFYNIMAYHNSGIEPDYNIRINAAGCRFFGMHLWGLADVSLVNNGYGCTYTGCHIEGGKTAKIDVYKAMEFYGRIYHHTGDSTNRVTAIRAMDSLYASTFIFDANLIYALFDLNNKWVSNVHVNANVNMTSDKLFLHNTFGVKDNVYINWGYNDTQYVWAIDYKKKVDTYNNIESVMQAVNEVHYNSGGARTFAINGGADDATGYVTMVPGDGNGQISATSTTLDNVDLRLMPKGNGSVNIGHTCINGADYNDFTKTGFYEALGSSTTPTQNAPIDNKNNNLYVIVENRDSIYCTQLAMNVRNSPTHTWRRTGYLNGTSRMWSNWVEIKDDKISDSIVMNNLLDFPLCQKASGVERGFTFDVDQDTEEIIINGTNIEGTGSYMQPFSTIYSSVYYFNPKKIKIKANRWYTVSLSDNINDNAWLDVRFSTNVSGKRFIHKLKTPGTDFTDTQSFGATNTKDYSFCITEDAELETVTLHLKALGDAWNENPEEYTVTNKRIKVALYEGFDVLEWQPAKKSKSQIAKASTALLQDNLVKFPYIFNMPTRTDCTITVNDDGTVTVTPDSGGLTSDLRLVLTDKYQVDVGQAYTIKGNRIKSLDVMQIVEEYSTQSATTRSTSCQSTELDQTFIAEQPFINHIIKINSGYTGSAVTFEPMLVKGEIIGDYVPYKLSRQSLREDLVAEVADLRRDVEAITALFSLSDE